MYAELLVAFSLKLFEKMNKKEAEQYFNWFMEIKSERISYLIDYVQQRRKECYF